MPVTSIAVGLAAAWIVIAGVAPVSAQTRAAAPAADDWRPTIGLPLPTIGLPLPAMGLPPAAASPGAAPPPPAGPGGQRRPRRGRQPRGSGRPVLGVPFFYLPPAGAVPTPGMLPADTSGGAADATRVAGSGRLTLAVTPGAHVQVYVDGYYVGTPDDYPDGLELTAGPHALELRGTNLMPVATSIQVPPGRAITYRADLEAKAAAAPGAPPAAAPAADAAPAAAGVPAPPASTFYVIPGCYLGNVPPTADNVPAGCDPGQAQAVRP